MATMTKRPESEILMEIQGIECALSPENLSCDGERPLAAQLATYRHLTAKKNVLIKELGRTPTDQEVWGAK